MSTPPTAAETLDWKFFQVFGSTNQEEVADVDIVSAIEFDATGDYFAAGDRGGRVVIFERSNQQTARGKRSVEYKYFFEFQSHEPEFDYLKSTEIEEKINKIRWLKPVCNSMMVLTTNDKTIKLWKVHKKNVKAVSAFNMAKPGGKVASLCVPQVSVRDSVMHATPRRVFSNAHAYHINSISLNSDGETFISADDLRVNLWNTGISTHSFNIVDLKPPNMEELTEVITAAEFHPLHCHLFAYSSSKGVVKLADMRRNALCDSQAKVFEDPDTGGKSFFSEIISSISDVKFSRDGKYMVTRDYLNVKVWDLAMEGRPVKVLPLHDHLRPKLCDLYENDSIFDKFEVALSYDANFVVSGSYSNQFTIFDLGAKTSTKLETTQRPAARFTRRREDDIEFSKKILHAAFHPNENLVAIGARSTIFLFNA